MRPIYETEKDLQREQAIAERVAAAWGGEMVKLIPRYSIDYVFIHDGECAAWVEIKSRTVASTTYPTYYASLHTVMFGKQMAAETGLPFFLVVSWSDTIKFLQVTKSYPIKYAGRTDRGDAFDKTPAYIIPIDEFQGLEND